MDLSSLTEPLKENETAAAVNLELLLFGFDWGSRGRREKARTALAARALKLLPRKCR
jgi:hypothetical protein